LQIEKGVLEYWSDHGEGINPNTQLFPLFIIAQEENKQFVRNLLFKL
jgi:hypothetical protein